MNTLTGEIAEITTEQNISLVKILAGGQLFYSIILDTPDTSPWLKKGAPIRLLFKETEVMIALPSLTPLRISVRNQILCRITAITQGAILCEITLSWPATAFTGFQPPPAPQSTQIKAIITRAACDALSLKENDTIIALIKTNEVSLAHD
jgi:molybdate transport system regulatory protein